MIWIGSSESDADLHHFDADPNPHQSDKSDTDPHQRDADSQHCLFVKRNAYGIINVIKFRKAKNIGTGRHNHVMNWQEQDWNQIST